MHASVSKPGRELMRAAQDTFFETVEERFLGRLSCDEVNTLGSLLGRLDDLGAPPCPGPGTQPGT